MSPPVHHPLDGHRRFPRVSGDEPAIAAVIAEKHQFSPRERG